MKWNKERWGTFVVASPEAVEQGLAEEGQTGVLLGTKKTMVYVIPSDRLTGNTYHTKFWIPIDEL